MRRRTIIFLLFIILIFLCTPLSAANEKQALLGNQQASLVLADLMQTFSTRPNVTEPDAAAALEKINQRSGQAMFARLAKTNHPKQICLLTAKLQNVLERFKEDYSNAADSETRAAITNDLYTGVLDSAENAGISYEQFILAVFKAGATLESKLDKKSALSLPDRELVNLLLTSTSYQLQFRAYFRNLLAAFEVIDPVPFPNWPAVLDNLQLMQTNIKTVLLKSLEEVLSDPLILSDAAALRNHQFNLAAQSDLTSFKILMSLFVYTGNDTSFHETLAARMREVGGVMANMDAPTLISTGVLSADFLVATEAAIYNWVTPEADVKFRPVNAIFNRLEELGADIRTAPDFALFENPYLAFFQLVYDSALLHDLTMAKWNQLGDEVLINEMRLANMPERYKLRNQESRLKDKIFKRLQGVKTEDKKAIRSLLTVPYFF